MIIRGDEGASISLKFIRRAYETLIRVVDCHHLDMQILQKVEERPSLHYGTNSAEHEQCR